MESTSENQNTPRKRGRKIIYASAEERADVIRERQKQYRKKYRAEFELWDSQASEEQKKLIRYLQKHVVPEEIIERVIGDIMTSEK